MGLTEAPAPPRLGRGARWPAVLTLTAVGSIYAALPDRVTVGPHWLPLAVVALLLVSRTAAHLTGRHDAGRAVAVLLTALVTAATAASALFLVVRLPGGGTTAPVLLGDAALIWGANILVFAVWYWEIDGGGPHQRQAAGYRPTDVLFPQTLAGPPHDEGWSPGFVDYLFLAFNTSTAFSPTDTLFLSRRAKGLMMAQATISLVVVAVLAARAINTL